MCLATNGATNKKVSDMHNRVSLINASGADYMISIHQNSYPEAEISGPQVFYYGSSEMSKKLAEAIQAQLIVDLQPPKEREIKTGNDLYIHEKQSMSGRDRRVWIPEQSDRMRELAESTISAGGCGSNCARHLQIIIRR